MVLLQTDLKNFQESLAAKLLIRPDS